MTSVNLPSSSVAPSSTSTSPQGRTSRPSSKAIAEQFCHQYYTVFSNYSRYLYRFYDQSSVQSIKETFEDGNSNEEYSNTQQEIHEVISRLFSDAKAQFEQISSQFSQNGGVLIQVSGILSRKGCRESNFAQSFFLAVQERGFYVLNDILNIIPRYETGALNGKEPQTTFSPESVPQPHTPRDGLMLGTAIPTSGAYSQIPASNPRPDPEQLNQILTETKELLSSTIQPPSQLLTETPCPPPPLPSDHRPRPSYADLLKSRNLPRQPKEAFFGGGVVPPTAGDGPQTRHMKTRSCEDVQMGSLATTVVNHSTSAAQHGGFLLPTRRRNSMTSGSLGFSRNASVFVRDIPQTMEEKDLRELFEQFGTVMSVVIRTGKRDSRFAFVDFAATVAMEQALAADSVSFQGRRLGIQEKKPIVIRNKTRFQNSKPPPPPPPASTMNPTPIVQFSSTRDLSYNQNSVGANAEQTHE